jgi:hypothetical protein
VVMSDGRVRRATNDRRMELSDFDPRLNDGGSKNPRTQASANHPGANEWLR